MDNKEFDLQAAMSHTVALTFAQEQERIIADCIPMYGGVASDYQIVECPTGVRGLAKYLAQHPEWSHIISLPSVAPNALVLMKKNA